MLQKNRETFVGGFSVVWVVRIWSTVKQRDVVCAQVCVVKSVKAAPIGAMQAESQRAAATAQPLCSWRLFWSGADFDITDPKHRKSF